MVIEETWDARELPILQAVYRAREDGTDLKSAGRGAVPDIDERRYIQTIIDLARAGFLDVEEMMGDDIVESVWINDMTPEGLRVVGAWPSGTLADQFLKALEQRAAAEQDPAKKKALETFLEGAYDVSKGVLAAVLTHVATRGL